MLTQILYTACVTPFTSHAEKVDYESLKNLLLIQEAAGNGVLLLGSTGEGLSLGDAEKREIVQFACQLHLQTQIIVSVSSYNLHAALEWIEYCNTLPIHGYLMTTPIYTKPGIMGQTHWFEKLLHKAAHPVMLYNIPGRAGVKLYPETVQNLRDHDKFQAIKDSSGTVDSIVSYQIAAPGVAVYCGDDYMMPSMAAEGAVGLVSVASNAWAAATRCYVQCCLDRLEITDKIWWKVCKAMFAASNPIPIKALMKDVEMISNADVRLPLSIEDLPSRQLLLQYHKLIHNWSDNHA